MSKVKPKPPKKKGEKEEKGDNSQEEISPVTHSRVRDHLSLALESNEIKKGAKENDGGTVVSRHASGGPCLEGAKLSGPSQLERATCGPTSVIQAIAL